MFPISSDERFTAADLRDIYRTRNNWGRWGTHDEVGAVNLIDSAKRVEAARLVTRGWSASMSRVDTRAALHPLERHQRGPSTGAVSDTPAVGYHGLDVTHIDALSHVWHDDVVWNGRPTNHVYTTNSSTFADVTAWSTGIFTRCVMLDVFRARGERAVTDDEPVDCEELEAIAAAGVPLEPGDAVAIYCGRDRWEQVSGPLAPQSSRPGLHPSCVSFFRDHDISVICWDFIDARPTDDEFGQIWGVHGVLWAFGIALIDNCDLAEVAAACTEFGRRTFLLTANPLRNAGATGSPINPVAVF